MPDSFNLDEIRKFWTQQATEHGASPVASWSDVHAIDLEIRTLLEYVRDGDRVLDVGCATGWSTMHWAVERAIRVRGIDYIPEMIAHANERLASLDDERARSVEFAVGDIMALDEADGSHDTVIVTRVVINLAEWKHQETALRECARVTASGGTLLLSEATVQGWQQLNALRAEWDLGAIPMPPFNQYLDQDQVIETLAPSMDLVEIRNFASSYYVGTRVLKPLLMKALGSDKSPAQPDMHINRWLSTLPAGGDYGTQKLFVFKKR